MQGISTYIYHAMQPNAGKYTWMLWDIRFHQPFGFLPQKVLENASTKPWR